MHSTNAGRPSTSRSTVAGADTDSDPGARADAAAGAPCAPLDTSQRHRLLAIARDAIRHGLDTGRPRALDLAAEAPPLRAPRAAFVTLELQGRLRGCIGHLEATQPLALDVSDNAFAAAFRDPRFPPLVLAELAPLYIKISVLTPAVELVFSDEADLLAQLVPGSDGLILADAGRRGTFLPAVWEQLPVPGDFLRRLKEKAGLTPDHWSDAVRVWRYRTESFGDRA
ncbi:AmmeMemoRadiSam system protein A [uncultured Thiohalocapsa sp.]|uniref:AmmeMemoRadiSam system protein A n=1 Tax=uncultured Thiohalocapsa sp. TaxID=768990 RepID=UPI0025FFE610|nr:AmmeMemoRadiSam system protein A [uncultured Thiohalocapsa sp.]